MLNFLAEAFKQLEEYRKGVFTREPSDLVEFKEEQEEILHSSYGIIYVTCTGLKPLLDAKEWIAIMEEQMK